MKFPFINNDRKIDFRELQGVRNSKAESCISPSGFHNTTLLYQDCINTNNKYAETTHINFYSAYKFSGRFYPEAIIWYWLHTRFVQDFGKQSEEVFKDHSRTKIKIFKEPWIKIHSECVHTQKALNTESGKFLGISRASLYNYLQTFFWIDYFFAVYGCQRSKQ